MSGTKQSVSSGQNAGFNADFLRIIAGKDDIFGGSAKYESVQQFLASQGPGNSLSVYGAAILFYEKPLQFLSKGSTKHSSDLSKAIDKGILRWVPKMSDEQKTEAAKGPTGQGFQSRLLRNGDFGTVNKTSIRILSLLFYHDIVSSGKDVSSIKIFNQFILKYGKKPIPEVIKDLLQKGDETSRIKAEGMEQFWAERFIWEKMKFT
jgi:hypothetical protein